MYRSILSIIILLSAIHTYSKAQTLAEALSKNDTILAAQLIEKGADPNATDANGSSLLMDACRWGNAEKVRFLLSHGANVRNDALRMIEWLATQNVELIEQPMAKEKITDHTWLTERSPIPIIADESVQRLPDVVKARGAYHGINVKLMKCTGMREAHKMVLLARALGLKVMMGCMTETSCAISAAAQLVPLIDYADLDGALLVNNDPFVGATIDAGKMIIPEKAGIGVSRRFAAALPTG